MEERRAEVPSGGMSGALALLERAKYAPAHYRKAQREWLDEAQKELRS